VKKKEKNKEANRHIKKKGCKRDNGNKEKVGFFLSLSSFPCASLSSHPSICSLYLFSFPQPLLDYITT